MNDITTLLCLFDKAKNKSFEDYKRGMNQLLKDSKLRTPIFVKKSSFLIDYDLDKVHNQMMEWFNEKMYKDPTNIAKLIATIYVSYGFNGSERLKTHDCTKNDLYNTVEKINALLPEIYHIRTEFIRYTLVFCYNSYFQQLLNSIGRYQNLTSESFKSYKAAEQMQQNKIANQKAERLEQAQTPETCELIKLHTKKFPAKKIMKVFKINTLAQMLTLWEDNNELFLLKLGLGEDVEKIKMMYCYLVSLGVTLSKPKAIVCDYGRQEDKLSTKEIFLNSKDILSSFVKELTIEETDNVLKVLKNNFPNKFLKEAFIDMDFICFFPSTRLYNCLKRNENTKMLSGILAIENIEQLRNIRNLGDKSIYELKKIMLREGYVEWVSKVFDEK